MGFKLRIESAEGGVTWADTSLMPVSRLWVTAMGSQFTELAVSLAYTTASGTLSNVKVAAMTFPISAGGVDGFVKKLATVAAASGDLDRDIARTTDACRGLVNADVRPTEIETLTASAVELVKTYWKVRQAIESGDTSEIAFNGYRARLISAS
jgi:hypothetical protein